MIGASWSCRGVTTREQASTLLTINCFLTSIHKGEDPETAQYYLNDALVCGFTAWLERLIKEYEVTRVNSLIPAYRTCNMHQVFKYMKPGGSFSILMPYLDGHEATMPSPSRRIGWCAGIRILDSYNLGSNANALLARTIIILTKQNFVILVSGGLMRSNVCGGTSVRLSTFCFTLRYSIYTQWLSYYSFMYPSSSAFASIA